MQGSYKTLMVGIVGGIAMYLSEVLSGTDPLNAATIVRACVAIALGIVAKDFNVSGRGGSNSINGPLLG